MAGYSGTPLVKKLGIKPGSRTYIEGAPEHYSALLGTLPEGATILPRLDETVDAIHLFTTEAAELARKLVR